MPVGDWNVGGPAAGGTGSLKDVREAWEALETAATLPVDWMREGDISAPTARMMEAILTGVYSAGLTANGEMYVVGDVKHSADSVAVTNGTITGGAVGDTRTINQTYLTVQETGKFEIAFTFSGLSTIPARANFTGRYLGNPAHNVFIEIYDYVGGTWDRVTAATNDFPSSATADYSLRFTLPHHSKYLSGDECQVRIRHDSNSVSSHYFYTDFIEVVELGLSMPVAGTSYLFTGFAEGESSGTTLSAAAGSITVSRDGVYDVVLNGSFEGLAGSLVIVCVHVNGVRTREVIRRKLESGGDVGNAGGGALLSLNAGDVLTVEALSDSDGAFVTIYNASFRVKSA